VGAAEESPQQPGDWFRVGLLRLGECLTDEEPPPLPTGKSLYTRLATAYQRDATTVVFGILLTVAVIVFALGWRIAPGHTEAASAAGRRPSGGTDTFVGKPHAPKKNSPDAAEAAPSVGGWGKSVGGWDKVDARTPQRFAGRSDRTLQDTLCRLAGTTAMTLTELAEKLRLSDEQLGQIRRVVAGLHEDLRRLGLEAGLDGSEPQEFAELYQKLLNECRRQILELLTPPQRASWDKLCRTGRADGVRKSARR
jgi:hypothetical protein